jgi:uncharacterized membrane protein
MENEINKIKKSSSRAIWMMVIGLILLASPILMPSIALLVGGISWLTNLFISMVGLSILLVPIGIIMILTSTARLFRNYFKGRKIKS